MANSTNSPSSAENAISRYVQGGLTEIGSLGLTWWERRPFTKDSSDIIYYVENQYEHRIDLISAEMYGDSRYWWVIAQYNDILDPHGEIYPGRMLVLPTKDRLFSSILTAKI